jgi:tetratricopeptide (TPR) repeat protein
VALQQLSGGDRLERGHALVVMGRAAMAMDAHDEAVEFFREAATSLGSSGASRQAGTVWRELGEAYVDLDRPMEAIEALRHASDLAGATYNPMRPEKHQSVAAVRHSVTS